MAKAFLRKTRESRVRSGHPWVFASDIEKVEGAFENGDVVDVVSWRGTFLGKAFYNPQSQISLRMLTQEDETIDEEFFARRIRQAWEYRKLLCDPMSCRLIYSESDFLPGLIVDKFILFEAVRKGGALPRKAFSMGEAVEKRYYLECRKIK